MEFKIIVCYGGDKVDKGYVIYLGSDLGYYTGKTYIYQGEKYACCSYDEKDAKVYKSEKVAKKSAEGICIHCENGTCNYSILSK